MSFLNTEFDIKFDCIKRLTKETEYINNILKTFDGEKMKMQYAIDNYMIDLYFIDYKIAIECDEFSHQAYDKNYEESRQKNIENKLECKFIRFNPDKDDFDIFEVINKIYLLIKLYR
jgi:very-short-patch-repair endonuclease